MDGAADVAETSYTPFQSKPDAAPVRLILQPTPGSQLALFATYSYHASPTGRGKPWHWRPTIGASRDRERHPRPQVRRGVEPSPLGPLSRQRRLAGGAGDRPQPGTLDGAHRSGRADRDHQDPATASFPWPEGSPARRASSLCICPSVGPGNLATTVAAELVTALTGAAELDTDSWPAWYQAGQAWFLARQALSQAGFISYEVGRANRWGHGANAVEADL